MSEALRSEGGADNAHLPPFSTFGDMADDQRLLTADGRLLDPGWEYYERHGDTVSVIASQPQYRPWESMPLTVNSKDAILRAGFSTPLDYQSVTLQPIPNKLPSFQSQFQTFPETTVIPETGLPSVTPVPVTTSPTPSASPSQLTQLTQLTTPSSPAHLTTLAQVTPLSTTLTTLSPVNATTFHTLTAVNARSYPLVPAPLQARELAPAGQTYIDDRHIQLYQPNIATINAFPAQNGILHQNGTILHQNGSLIQNIQSPTVVHVLKNEPFDVKSLQDKYTPNGLHHSNFQNPMLIDNGYEKKTNGFGSGSSPTRSDFRKKERRKMRANSSESDGSNMEVGSESSGQVAAVSSTAGFKSPMHGAPPMNTGPMELDDISSEKQTKKKRKRCGECIGCQRKDNCGDCAPCRNDKSHQICKQRRCEKLTEKKLILAPDGTLQTVKSESRRGRGRGRSSTTPVLQDIKSYRGRKPLGGSAGAPGAGLSPGVPGLSPGVPGLSPAVPAASPSPAPAPAAPSPAPATTPAMKQDHPSQPMAPMPFYAGDPNRFPTTWQTDPSQGWQNQFIQQLPTQTGQTTLDYQGNHTAYATSPHYQANTTYTVQNVATTFDVTNNTYYQTGVQSVPAQRPPSNRGAYTPVPSPRAPHYTAEYQQQYAQQAPTPGATTGNDSRPASAASYQTSVPTSAAPVYTVSQQNYDRTEYTSEHSEDQYQNTDNGSSDTNNDSDRQEQSTPNGQHSGNAEPGYLQGSSGPRASLDCSGYSGGYNGGQYRENGQQQNQNDWQQRQWQHNQRLQNQQIQNQQQMQNQQQLQSQQQQMQNQQQQIQNQQQQQLQNQQQQIQNQQQQQLQNQQQQQQQMQNQQQQQMQNQQQQQMQNQQQQQMQSQQQQQMQNHQNQQMQNQQMQQQNQENAEQQMFSQSDRVNLNSRLKTMILNKQNHTRDGTNTPPDKGDPGEGPPRVIDDRKGGAVSVGDDRNTTGHFLSYSHHLRNNYRIGEQAYPLAGNYAQNAQAYGAGEFGGGGHQVWEGGTEVPRGYDKHATSKNVSKTPQKLPSYADMRGQFGAYSNESYGVQKYTEMYGSDSLSYNQPDNKDFQSKMLIGPVSEMNQQLCAPARDTNAQRKAYDREAYDAKFRHPSAPLIPKLEIPDNTYQYPKDERLMKNSQQIQIAQNQIPQNHIYRDYPNGLIARSQQNTVLPPISSIKQENFGQKATHFQNFQSYGFERRQELPEAYAQIPRQENMGFQKYNRNFGEPKNDSDNRMQSHKNTPVEPKPPYYIEQIKSEHSPPGHKIYKNMSYPPPRNEPYMFPGDGGPMSIKNEVGYSCCRQGSTKKPPPEHLRDGACPGLQTKDEILEDDPDSTDKNDPKNQSKPNTPGPEQGKLPKENHFNYSKEYLENLERLRNNSRTEVPDCNCFPADKNPPEPGSYYTHLGAASSLAELRKDLEARTGLSGKELRIEKICYTGKEGKSAQGCPIAKWVIRRSSYTEKVLVVVKCRAGHKCATAWIVVCLVAWEGIPASEADLDYTLLAHKLNRYGLPTTRRCATNENRTCACQGLDPETCGASYSFGCSWSMYYNGCKYARSKTVRKFRLSVKTEESEIEERMHVLATLLSPLYMNLAPKSFENQCQFEKEASDCRLGFKPGRPFSGVTACIDFCAHAHRDLHNMNNGCTAVVTLARHRSLARPPDEQLHVLPLYVLDSTDEFGSADAQDEKLRSGALEILDKFPMEVRVRSVPLQPCRRHGKKRKEEETSDSANTSTSSQQSPGSKKPQCATPAPRTPQDARSNPSPRSQSSASPRAHTPALNQPNPTFTNNPPYNSAFVNPNMHNQNSGLINSNLSNPALLDMATMIDNFTDAQLQSNQISSTVLDSPYNPYDQSYNLHHQNALYNPNNVPSLVEGNSCQNSNPNQLPSFASGLQKREQQFNPQNPAQMAAMPHNQWSDFANAEMFNNVVKEDPDSTTAHLNVPPNYSPDSNRSETNSDPMSQKNTSEPDKQSMIVGDIVNKLPEFEMPNSPRLTEISQNPQNKDPESPAPSQIPELKSPNNDALISTEVRKSVWKSPESKNWDSTKPKEQLVLENENSLFRVPKARPPSRSQHSNAPEAMENSTFLKPYPPSERPQLSQGYEHRSPYDNRLPNNTTPQTSTAPQTNFTISHDDQNMHLGNKPNPEFTGNNFHAVSQNSYGNQTAMQGYGNYPQMPNTYPFPPNPYGHFNPYENSYNDYNSLAYYNAEKYKREELLRNPHCYNSYGYQYNPNFTPNFYQNPSPNWCQSSPNWCLYPPPFSIPYPPEPPKAEPIGEVTDFTDNLDCFKDSQMGGVAIALGHGSVLFECAKHEMHSTTAVKTPNRVNPTRISLVFYQHRNLNRPKHGLEEWEEKMRLKKLGLSPAPPGTPGPPPTPAASPAPAGQGKAGIPGGFASLGALVEATQAARRRGQLLLRTDTSTTMSWTTLFPMHPCTVTGPYQESAT